jgi:hypothetical protein
MSDTATPAAAWPRATSEDTTDLQEATYYDLLGTDPPPDLVRMPSAPRWPLQAAKGHCRRMEWGEGRGGRALPPPRVVPAAVSSNGEAGGREWEGRWWRLGLGATLERDEGNTRLIYI